MEPRVAILEEELTQRREHYNALFALARRARPRLDGEQFAHNLRRLLAPVVAGIPAQHARPTVEPLYNLCLSLTASEHFRRSPALVEVWSRLLPQAGQELIALPAYLPAALSNAAYNLERQEGVDVGAWLGTMERLRPLCLSPEVWLKVGQVAAWLCGMAHYREQAIELGESLTPELRSALHPEWDRVIEDPWHGHRPADGRPRVVRTVGGFLGFGGKFRQPPWVAYCGEGRFLVEDGSQSWVLSSDAFGSTLKSGTAEVMEDVRWDVGVNDHGELRWGDQMLELPKVGKVRGQAISEDLLVLSREDSHRLVLILGPPR